MRKVDDELDISETAGLGGCNNEPRRNRFIRLQTCPGGTYSVSERGKKWESLLGEGERGWGS